jgi:hypothetical protein
MTQEKTYQELDFRHLLSSLRLRVSAVKNLVWKARNRGIQCANREED